MINNKCIYIFVTVHLLFWTKPTSQPRVTDVYFRQRKLSIKLKICDPEAKQAKPNNNSSLVDIISTASDKILLVVVSPDTKTENVAAAMKTSAPPFLQSDE